MESLETPPVILMITESKETLWVLGALRRLASGVGWGTRVRSYASLPCMWLPCECGPSFLLPPCPSEGLEVWRGVSERLGFLED